MDNARKAVLREKVEKGTILPEECREIIADMRQGRVSAAYASAGTKTKKVKKEKNIKIMGRLDYSKVISLYKRCAAMITPIRRTSDYQSSIPNKVHEGVAYGLPIITSLTGSTKQYLNKMKKGIFYDPSSQKSFTKALKIFLKWKCKNQSRQIYLEKELKDNYKQLCNKILAMAN